MKTSGHMQHAMDSRERMTEILGGTATEAIEYRVDPFRYTMITLGLTLDCEPPPLHS